MAMIGPDPIKSRAAGWADGGSPTGGWNSSMIIRRDWRRSMRNIYDQYHQPEIHRQQKSRSLNSAFPAKTRSQRNNLRVAVFQMRGYMTMKAGHCLLSAKSRHPWKSTNSKGISKPHANEGLRRSSYWR